MPERDCRPERHDQLGSNNSTRSRNSTHHSIGFQPNRQTISCQHTTESPWHTAHRASARKANVMTGSEDIGNVYANAARKGDVMHAVAGRQIPS